MTDVHYSLCVWANHKDRKSV